MDQPEVLQGVHRAGDRSEEHTSELQSPCNLVCRLLLEKKKANNPRPACAGLAVAPQNAGTAIALHASTLRLRDVPLTRDIVSSELHFFFNDTATTEIYTLSLHDALPI